MKLDIFRTLWGVQDEVSSYAAKLKEAGFIGVEARIPSDTKALREFGQALTAQQLEYIGILFSGGDVIPSQAERPAQHLARIEQELDRVAALQPRFINLLAGNDRWSLAEQVDFFGQAQEIAQRRGVLCSFETHRATSLYSPWVTLELIRQLPDLRFTMDLSHWVLVCERLLDDPEDDLSAFISRVHHIQARVGHAQAPQAAHPAAPEYSQALAFYQQVWESVWLNHLQAGREVTTLTTEFGPDGYLPHLPFTNVPVADLWSLNDWMANTERQHFDRFIQSDQARRFVI